jgi:hypothetical protein
VLFIAWIELNGMSVWGEAVHADKAHARETARGAILIFIGYIPSRPGSFSGLAYYVPLTGNYIRLALVTVAIPLRWQHFVPKRASLTPKKPLNNFPIRG